MARITLGQAKKTRLPQVMGICATEPRFVQWLNEAVQQCLFLGKWVGTYGRYQICACDGCLTWPRQIETIETIAVCDRPIPVRNEWFEFLEQGVGIQQTPGCDNGEGGGGCYGNAGQQLLDRGTACTFNDIVGLNKKVRVYADVAEASGAQILLIGYDENGNWIRTQTSGVWHDGEYVTLSTAPQTSIHFFTKLSSVIKPITNGFIRLYEYNNDLTTQRALAIYEPSEQSPNYRRSLVNALCRGGCSNPITDESKCQRSTITVMAKLAFIPVVEDNDFLLIGNIPALKAMVKAVMYGEQDKPDSIQKAVAQKALAKQFLQEELDSYQGDGAKISLNIETNSGMGVGPVESLI